MRKEIRIAGFGGQGVITMGSILAVAAWIIEDLEVAQTQSYGPEARGGACRTDVVISDEPIDYTKPLALDFFIAMSPSGLEKYWGDVRPGKTVVLVDRTLVNRPPVHDPPVLAVEATRIAEEEFKERVVANMIVLGAMAALTGWVRLEALLEAVKRLLPAKAHASSQAAIRRGFAAGSEMNLKKG